MVLFVVSELRVIVRLELWYLTPLSTIFQLYRGGQFFGGGNRSTWIKSNELRREVIVRFFHIGGIVVHHCLNFLFIFCMYIKYSSSSNTFRIDLIHLFLRSRGIY